MIRRANIQPTSTMTDPISDFLTRLRNASKAGLAECVSPHSKLKESLAAILKTEGYVARRRDRHRRARPQDPRRDDEVRRRRPGPSPASSASSTPGRRLYSGYTEIPRVLNGLGIAIVSTSKGLMKDQDCRRQKLGGELVCTVW